MDKNIFLVLIITLVFTFGPPHSVMAREDLRFAITSAVASDPAYKNYRELTNYVADKVGRKPVFVSGLTYSQVDNLFVKREVDVGFLCNSHFARRRDAVKFEAIAAPIIEGHVKPKFRIYIIVPKDSSLKSMADLRGKTVDLSDPLSTTTIFAAYMLQKRNETLKSFFGKTIYSGSHDMTVKLVAAKMVDAGMIDGHIWDYHDNVQPAYSSRTRVIYRSQEFTTPPVVVSPGTDESVRRKIRNVLLTMHEDEKGRLILKKLRIRKFADIGGRDYDDVLDIYNKVKGRL